MAARCVQASLPAGSYVCGVRVSSRVMSSRRSTYAVHGLCQSVSVGSFSKRSRV